MTLAMSVTSLYILQAWPMYGRRPQYILASGQREFGDKSANSCKGVSEAEKNHANGSITNVVYILFLEAGPQRRETSGKEMFTKDCLAMQE